MRGFAFSTPVGEDEPDWEMLKRWAAKTLQILLPDERLSLVNVNFPTTEPRGVRCTLQSVKQDDGKSCPSRIDVARAFWFTGFPRQPRWDGSRARRPRLRFR